MNDSKFNSIKERAAGLTAEQYKTSYPQLTEAQIKILTQGEANEPSRKSIFGTTKADK